MILASKEYYEECAKECLNAIIDERKERVENERRNQEIQEPDQIERKVSQEVKDHFIDDRPKLNSLDDLVQQMDNYDTLRSTFSSKQPRKEGHYYKRNSFKDDSPVTTDEKGTNEKKGCT
ncbi:hypothetical protein AVEN_257943-1 [Araneus ventricosus]|uniref:Uncharacterized protein n=1 Tax=Araneus ventricosus TaxID=182803 RepID=A0A4Y2SVX4_ARAVE|nr:hypothetical protein AVEN_257943-1 [Araneus ventricosus]